MNRTLVSVALISWGCGGPAFENLDATGGTSSSGGDATSEGGTATNGGTTSTGGVEDSGGTTSGGRGGTSSGGRASTGGTTSTGGKASTGGTMSTGGKASTGGTHSGGTSNGGGVSTGGKASTGGTMSTGGTSSGGTTSMGGASSGGTGGLSGMSCDQLRERYRVVLGEAQVCELAVPDPCSEQVKSDLFCGCTTFVSNQHPSLLDELSALSEEAASRPCAVACPAIKCIEPVGGTCAPSATTGTEYACKIGISATTN